MRRVSVGRLRGGLLRRIHSEEHGAIAVVVAITMTVMLGMAALVVDIGAIETRKAQLQNAADAAALAIAQQCAEASTAPGATTLTGCDSHVTNEANATAASLASKNLNDRQVAVDQVLFDSAASTVQVTVSSTQQGFFSSVLGVESTRVTASATAKWQQPAYALPLAFDACEFDNVSTTQLSFLRTDLLGSLLDPSTLSSCGLLPNVGDVLVPGWLSSMSADCSYSVNLGTFVIGTLEQLLGPPAACDDVLPTLINRQVLLPVYQHPIGGVIVGCVLLTLCRSVTQYALVDLTGYDFQPIAINALGGIVNLAPLGTANISGDPQCPFLIDLGIVKIKALTCQGIQGTFRGLVSPEEAVQLQAGARLIA